MIQLEPGSLVQYQRSNSLGPPWPAILCTDDMAPEDMLQTRPYGNVHVTLVLILGNELNFRWARMTELSEYDPFVPFTNEAMVAKTPGLRDAYEMANNALEASLGLDYWQEQTVQLAGVSDTESSVSKSYIDIDIDSDLELQEAIRLSRDTYYDRPTIQVTRKPRDLPTPSRSPPESTGKVDGQRTVPSQKITGSFEPPLVSARPRESFSQALKNGRGCEKTPSGLHNTVIDLTGDENTSNSNSNSNSTTPIKKLVVQQSSFLDDAWRKLNDSLGGATSDTVDGEISESKQFVQVRVGPAEEFRILRQHAVWNRPYFRDPRWGLNHFDHIDGVWQLLHPALRNIDPFDFDFAAEYLESDGFGIRTPRDEEEMTTAFAQCCVAWTVADKLGMHDLLDHIVDKLESVVEPRMNYIMHFASYVYDSSSDTIELPAHYRLKEYLAMYMASNWWLYICDEGLSADFIELLQQAPELERDIYEVRLQALNERLGEDDEDKDKDEDGDEGGGEQSDEDIEV